VKTGNQKLRVDASSTRTRSATTTSRSATHDKNYVDQLDSSVFANLKPGVSPEAEPQSDRRGRQAVSERRC
jgi:hypothetical protein